MKMQASMNAGGKRMALIRIRVEVDGIPTDAYVSITDMMFQPGGSSSGWLPHVTELPWSAGVTPP